MHLVFLHGPAASGKLTTAEALEARLGWPVFHNHLVVDLLTTVFPFGSEPFVRLREQFWLAVIEDAATADRSLVFTFAPEPTVPQGFPDRVRGVVAAAGGRVHFVRLLVSDSEQERRIGLPSRRRFHKLADVGTLRSLRREGRIVEEPPVDLEVGTDDSSPERTAAVIVERFTLSPQRRPDRYPQR